MLRAHAAAPLRPECKVAIVLVAALIGFVHIAMADLGNIIQSSLVAACIAAALTILLSSDVARNLLCCWAASPLAPGPRPATSKDWTKAAAGNPSKPTPLVAKFAPWLTHEWEECQSDAEAQEALLAERGFPWAARKLLNGTRASVRFSVEGDTVVMLTKVYGLVVAMRFPPQERPQRTENKIPLPGFPVHDVTVTCLGPKGKAASLCTESSTFVVRTGATHMGSSECTLDAATDQVVIALKPGEDRPPVHRRFRRGQVMRT